MGIELGFKLQQTLGVQVTNIFGGNKHGLWGFDLQNLLLSEHVVFSTAKLQLGMCSPIFDL